MKKLALAALALLVLAPATMASATIWETTAAGTAQEIQQLSGGVSSARCEPLPTLALQREYGAVSKVYPDGTRKWNIFLCAILFRSGGYCGAVAYITGQAYGSLRLGTWPSHGCTPYVLHRHRALWDRPDVFDPSRFLGNRRSAIDRFAYLPFGVGPRKCIGSVFALQEATIVLAAIAKNFDFALCPNHKVWPILRVTLRPANGLPSSRDR